MKEGEVFGWKEKNCWVTAGSREWGALGLTESLPAEGRKLRQDVKRLLAAKCC